MAESKLLLEFQGVTLGYGRKPVLSGLNFAIAEGDFLGIVGPNGAGKTTILRALLGELKPLQGRINYSQNNGRLRFGYVPQRQEADRVFPLSALEVVLMGRYGLLGPGRKPKAADYQSACDSLAYVGLEQLSQAPYWQLSGGQKQRVLIARALTGEPNLLILDEPTNDLDIAGEKAVMALIRRLHDERFLTTVVVSHLLNVVANYVKQIAFVNDRDFIISPLAESFTGENLSHLYGVPVIVGEVGGRKVVL